MLFNNKITTDKNQAKLYKKGRELIDGKADGIDHAVLLDEGLESRHSRLVNKPSGMKSVRREVFKRRSNAIKNVSEKLFKESLFEVFYESLLIDEYFKKANRGNLYNLFDETFNNLMNEKYISWDNIKNDSSTFIENLFIVCEDVAKEKAEKNITFDSVKDGKLDNMKVPENALLNEKNKKKEDETATRSDKEKVDEKMDDDKKDVSEVIKDKVVDTVKKEKEKSEEEDAQDEEIKEKTKTEKEKEKEEETSDEDTETDKEEDSDKEENLDTDDEPIDAEPEEDDDADSDKDSKDDSKDDDDDDDDDDKDKDDDSKDDSKDEDKTKSESFYFYGKFRKPNKLKNTSLFRSIEINVSNKFLKEKSEGNLNEDIQMNYDLIFAESLTYYTLLETFNTVGILKMRPSELKSLCKELILK